MKTNYRLLVTAILILAAPFVTSAGSLRCGHDIVSPGDTEQQLLETCGEPKAREGDDWLYEMPGCIPVVVSVSRGVITFIRERDESDAFDAHPFGDRP